jgi:peptidoglycan/LPS O-acetylase OafA/YrhL
LKVYFKGFNELRAIGALSVIFGHIELIKSFNGIDNFMHINFYRYTNGHIGVMMFFVLSGFLITYFLIREINETQTINFKLFYFKRLTRIWPIYYIMVIFSVYIFPFLLNLFENIDINYSFNQTKFYLLFLPNIGKNLNYQINGASHLWSIGVEEQFYLIWPILLYFFRKYIFILLVIIFITFSLANPFIDFISYNFHVFKANIEMKNFLNSFFSSFKINAMSLGGIFAYLLLSNNLKWLNKILFNRYFEVTILLITAISWIFGIQFGTLNDEIYCLLFGVIVYNIASNKQTIIRIENKLLFNLGKISYGLYVYHWIIIVLLIKVINYNYFNNNLVYNIILYLSTFLCTIVASKMSYNYIEKPLINLKKRI